jgi:hypothetical protein
MIKQYPPIWKDWNEDMTLEFVRSKKEIYAIRRWHWGDELAVSSWITPQPPYEVVKEIVCREHYKVYKLPS